MTKRNLLALFCALALISVSVSYRHFQERIPNGDVIPHPCKPNFIWRGVGHYNALGGGAKNPFGVAFADEGHKWTKALCQADSDGDGMTNGQELGDPNCVWTEASGQFPERTKTITHPGICDPFDSPQCKAANSKVNCGGDDFNCPAIHEQHVRNISLRFPRTRVPAAETSYMCMSFELNFPLEDPEDAEYHIIATQPIIDNPNVMHHTVLFSCSAKAKSLTKPELCYMSQDGCGGIIGLWTLGMPGECIYKEAGIKIGKGSRRVMMQHHWTNPALVEDFFDSSGMVIYYTTKLRKYDAGFFTTGQNRLEIPPGRTRWEHTASCTSECTRKIIQGSIHLISGLNHMHYLGFQEDVKHYRNDVKIETLTPDEVYSYDNPKVYQYDPPRKILPGDRLDTKCVYRSTSRSQTTYFGEGTYDEMCYGIFTYYPAQNLTHQGCVNWGNIDTCKFENGMYESCNAGHFANLSHPDTQAMRKLVLDSCNFYGPCRAECPSAIAKARETYPCLRGDVGEYMLWSLNFRPTLENLKFSSAMSSCDCPVDGTKTHDGNKINDGNISDGGNGSATQIISTVLMLLTFLCHMTS